MFLCISRTLVFLTVVATGGRAFVEGSSQDLFEMLKDSSNYPLNLKFGRPKITTNEKIVLASIFYPLYALAVQLSPELKSSGIQVLFLQI